MAGVHQIAEHAIDDVVPAVGTQVLKNKQVFIGILTDEGQGLFRFAAGHCGRFQAAMFQLA